MVSTSNDSLHEQMHRLHRRLITKIASDLDSESGEGQNFLFHIKEILGAGIYSSHKSVADKIKALETKIVFGLENYEGLKNICKDSGNLNLIEIIETCEDNMKGIRSKYQQNESSESSKEEHMGIKWKPSDIESAQKEEIKRRRVEDSDEQKHLAYEKVKSESSESSKEVGMGIKRKRSDIESEPKEEIKRLGVEDSDEQKQKAYEKAKSDKLPQEILNMDEKSIQLYKKVLKEGKVSEHKVRVMVLGHSGVGKSTLTKRLLNMPVDISQRDSTEGIEVHKHRCNVSEGNWNLIESDEERSNHKKLAKLLKSFINNSQELLKKKKDEKDFVNNSYEPEEKENENFQSNEDATNTTVEHKQIEALNEIDAKIKEDLKKVIESEHLKEEESASNDISVWDFAGENMYYSTHQVFLCRNAIYLLVTNISKDKDEQVDDQWQENWKVLDYVDFWLSSIYEYCLDSEGNGPPVVLVGAFADKLSDKTSKEEAVNNLADYLIESPAWCLLTESSFAIDNTDSKDENIQRLREHILDVASKQKNWGVEVPAKWLTLDGLLMGLKNDNKKFIEKDELKTLNLVLPAKFESEELELYLRFHHEAGNFLYFSQEGLTQYIILDPQWLIDTLKRIIMSDSKWLRKQKDNELAKMMRDFRETGLLKHALLDAILKEEENMESFDKRKQILLECMKTLGLIASLKLNEGSSQKENSQEELFVPSKLQRNPPNEDFCYKENNDCKYSSKLCVTSKNDKKRFLPVTTFNKFLAYCLKEWILEEKKSKFMIFKNSAIFKLSSEYRLYIIYCNNVIQAWLIRYRVDHELPEPSVCIKTKEKIKSLLELAIGKKSNIELFVRCPEAEVFSTENMFKLAEMKENESEVCYCHKDGHHLHCNELAKYWIYKHVSKDEKFCCTDECFYDSRLIKLTEAEIEELCREGNTSKIGSGSFGTVYKSKTELKRFGILLAVKKICFDADEEMKERSIKREMIACRLLNPFILPLLAAFKREMEFWFVSPYCDKSDLRSVLKSDKMLKDGQEITLNAIRRVKILLQISLAIKYIHTQVKDVRDCILHKDISSANVVLDDNYNARLIDFGLAREKDDKTTHACGNKYYSHPDVGTGKHANESWDYYSYGVIIKEMLTSLGPEGRRGTYLKNMSLADVEKEVEKRIWKSENVIKELNQIADSLTQQDSSLTNWTASDFTSSVTDKLKKMHTNFGSKLTLDVLNSEKCHSCMINEKAKKTSLIHSVSMNCRQKIEVCMACEKNSFLNPVICYCGEELTADIGSNWGALLVSGRDTKGDDEKTQALIKDVVKFHKVLTSLAPRIFGIREANIRKVVPIETGNQKSISELVEEQINEFRKKRNIDTLLIFISCHGEADSSKFQFGAPSDSITNEKFQDLLETLNVINNLIIILDRCYAPMVQFKEGRKFVQINSCNTKQKAEMNSEGSTFTKFLIRGLKAKSGRIECNEGCKHCNAYWKRNTDFITFESLYEYIRDHMKDQDVTFQHKLYDRHPYIAFNTGERVFVTFHCDTSGENKSIQLELDYYKNIEALKTKLKEVSGQCDKNVKIQRHTPGRKEGQTEECNTLEKVMLAWTQRQELEVIFD